MGKFFGYGCSNDDAEQKKLVLEALDLVLLRLKEHIEFSEANYEPDSPERLKEIDESVLESLKKRGLKVEGLLHPESDQDYKKQAEQSGDKLIEMSGFRLKRLGEVRELREIFASSENADVPEEILTKVNAMFSSLILSKITYTYFFEDCDSNVTRDIVAQIRADIRVYTLALHAIGDSATILDDPYPFDDFNLLLS